MISIGLQPKKISPIYLQLQSRKKGQGEFIKGPLNIQLIRETIEKDNYDRKYEEKKKKRNINQHPIHQVNIRNRLHIRNKPIGRNKLPTRSAITGEQTGPPNTHGQHGSHSATIVKRPQITPKYAFHGPILGLKKNERMAHPTCGQN